MIINGWEKDDFAWFSNLQSPIIQAIRAVENMSKSTTPNTNIAELLLRRVSKIVYMPIETNVVIRNMIPANMPLEDELKAE